jgi:hypothetical protein
MEAASTSETLVNFYQTTRRYNPEDSNIHASLFDNTDWWRFANYSSRNEQISAWKVCYNTDESSDVVESAHADLSGQVTFEVLNGGEYEDGCLLGCSAV